MQKYLCLFLFFVGLAPLAHAQFEADAPIVLDERVRTGKLENGLHYFLMQNKKPEKRLELRLAIKAGSILETEEQQGLAHFLEHMAFNGSKNFKKNELVDYLQSIGVEFGSHLNAYTSFDETVYMLRVPTDKPELVDKGFTVLEDWAGGMLLEEEEINKERGVVIEEWRGRLGANERMMQKNLPRQYPGSRYAERLPIGKVEILENFEPKVLRAFYEDWYRPNLMAVIVVGDLPLDEMEKQVKAHMGKLKNPKKQKERKYYPAPEHEGPIFAFASDKEAPMVQIQLAWKRSRQEAKTMGDMRKSLVARVAQEAWMSRLNDIRMGENPPFSYAFAFNGGSLPFNQSAWNCFAVTGGDKAPEALKTLFQEARRLELHGITTQELKRAQATLLRQAEQQAENQDKQESRKIAQELVSYFLEKDPMLNPQFYLDFLKAELDKVTAEEVNTLFKEKIFHEKNFTVSATMPESAAINFTEERAKVIYEEVKKMQLDAPKEEEAVEQLMPKPKTKVELADQQTDEASGVTTLTYANGIKVRIKPTDFRKGEFMMGYWADGGHSLAEDEDFFSARYCGSVRAAMGMGSLKQAELQKLSSTKGLYGYSYVRETSQGGMLQGRTQDMELALQMLALTFDRKGYTFDEEAFKSMKQREIMMVENQMKSPDAYFYDQFSRFLSQNHPRTMAWPKAEDLEKVDPKKALEFYHQRFNNAAAFEFYIVGDVNIEEFSELMGQYFSALPANKMRNMPHRDLGIRPPKAPLKEVVHRGKEPKSKVILYLESELEKYSNEERATFNALSECVQIHLTEILREQEGGTYSPGGYGFVEKVPYAHAGLQIFFGCSPDNTEKLEEKAKGILKDFYENGVPEKTFAKVKETLRRKVEESQENNRYWFGKLAEVASGKLTLEELAAPYKYVESLTLEKVNQTAKQHLGKEVLTLVLKPEK